MATLETAPTDRTADGTLNNRHMRMVLASSLIGSTIEAYDFALYAVAASIVFNHVFFAGLGPGFALLASFGTLATGYIARPLGGIIAGHFGDRVGRKKVLVITMLTMGIASTAIGLLPTTEQVGALAPTLLIVLRVIQGIALGGEWGGAILLGLEHAPSRKRAFAASFANMGSPAGAVLATLAMSLFTLLPDEQFLTWGWRVPFLFSAVLVLIGLLIRLRVTETPVFARVERRGEQTRVPVLEVLRSYPRNLIITILVGMAGFATVGLMTVWAVSEMVASGADPTAVLNIKAFASVVMVASVAIGAKLADRYGRRPVLIAGTVLGAVLAFPILMLIQGGTLWGFAIAVVLGNGLVEGIIYGAFAAFAAELFPSRVRYTGVSLSAQGAATLAGLTPAVATGLVLAAGGSYWMVGTAWIVVFLLALGAVLLTREGKNKDLDAIR